MKSEIEYSIIIPVYNSSESLIELSSRIETVFKTIVKKTYELIFIDDGSPNPETWPMIEKISAEIEEVIGIRLIRNFGKSGAMLCGFSNAIGRYLITMDDDLQHIPEDIPELIKKKSHDVVMGNFKLKKHSFLVRLTSSIKGWFDKRLIGKPEHLTVSPFKLFRSEIVKNMLRISTPYPFIPALMFYVTKDVVAVDITHCERKYGKSEFTLKKRIKQFLMLLINNSSFLLQVVSSIGLFISLASISYSVLLVIKKLFYNINVSGWTSIMVVLLVTNGLILFSFGIVGEYLIRIINGIEKRPPFIERYSTDKQN